MNFDWTDEDKTLKARVQEVFGESALQDLDAMEEADPSPLKRILTRFQKELAETGYLDVAVGPGHRHRMLTLMAGQEEVARVSGSLFLSVEVTARMFARVLSTIQGNETVDKILSAVRQGELVGAVATTEPAQPDSSGTLTTTAWQDGESYRLTGQKDFVTNGPIADWFVISGLVEDKPSLFLVEPSVPGLVIGERIRTLGYNGLCVAPLELNEVRLPQSRVLGPPESQAVLDDVRLIQDLVLSIASVGLMQRTTAEARRHSSAHERDGKPVVAHQEVRFKLAEMLTLTQTSQLLTYRAGWMYANSDSETRSLVGCAKVFAAEASERVANLAMQIMAGQGYVWGNVVERGYREAKYSALAGTTSEIARMSIAEDVLTRYR